MPHIDPARWRKSSHSGAGNNCVEAAGFGDLVGLRDSQAPERGHIVLTGAEWRALIAAVRNGAPQR